MSVPFRSHPIKNHNDDPFHSRRKDSPPTHPKRPESVYIHIPFCHRICPYCDFNKVVLEGQPVRDYLLALEKEMEHTLSLYPPSRIRTVFVGGGTPTALNASEMGLFLESVRRCLHPYLAEEAEIEFTMEANPGSVDAEKLDVMRQGGVNRLSFGVQSFDNRMLQQLGRIHNREDVFHSLKLARASGFANLSLDLMFGLPRQTPDMFAETLQIALSLDIPHFSAYSLKVEEGTHFYKLQNEGKLPLPSEDDEYTMYEQVIEQMTAQGYRHYEISNFAKSGYECRHNMTYWRNEHFYGFGAGAHGYIGNVRYENAGPLEAYMRLVDQQGMPHVERLEVSMAEEVENLMIMGLRTREGVERANFHARFGVNVEDVYGEELSALRRKGLVTLRNDRYVLTKKGIYFGNDVFLAFFQSEQAEGIDNREGV